LRRTPEFNLKKKNLLILPHKTASPHLKKASGQPTVSCRPGDGGVAKITGYQKKLSMGRNLRRKQMRFKGGTKCENKWKEMV